MTPTWGEKDIMYEAINSSAAKSRKAERVRVECFAMLVLVESTTVASRSGRRTELARASSGNLH